MRLFLYTMFGTPISLNDKFYGVSEAATAAGAEMATTINHRNSDGDIADKPLLTNCGTEPSGRLLSDGRALVYPHKVDCICTVTFSARNRFLPSRSGTLSLLCLKEVYCTII